MLGEHKIDYHFAADSDRPSTKLAAKLGDE